MQQAPTKRRGILELTHWSGYAMCFLRPCGNKSRVRMADRQLCACTGAIKCIWRRHIITAGHRPYRKWTNSREKLTGSHKHRRSRVSLQLQLLCKLLCKAPSSKVQTQMELQVRCLGRGLLERFVWKKIRL